MLPHGLAFLTRSALCLIAALACWSGVSAAAALQERVSWNERREELRTLDMRAADDETLFEVLDDMGSAAAPQDAFAVFAAGRAAYVLGERLRNRGEFARAREVVEVGLAACTAPGGMRPFLLLQAADLATYAQEYENALALLESAEEALDEAQRDSALPASILSLRGQLQLH